jgi:hypothetical protein
MSYLTTVTLTDATPTDHDFLRRGSSDGNIVLTDNSAETALGRKTLIVGSSPANAQRSTDKLTIRLNYPVEHEVDSVTEVAHTARFRGEFVLPGDMSTTERAHFAAMISDLISESEVVDHVGGSDSMS